MSKTKRRSLVGPVTRVWQDVGDDFFLRHTPRQVAGLTAAIATHNNEEPLIQVLNRKGQVSEEGATEICIYLRDRPGLFAAMVCALGHLGLSVHDASIHTAESGWCLNSFIVLEEDSGDPPGRTSADRDHLTRELAGLLAAETAAPPRRRLTRQLKQLPTPTGVSLKHREGADGYELTIIASDRPGLLATIAMLFAELGVNLLDARIATLGERVEDTFTLSDLGSGSDPANIEERFYLLENTIRQQLDSTLARDS